MILAAGLTPAWQHVLVFDRVHVGEVNRAVAAERCASGKVLNVGIALTRLGCESLTVAPIGGSPAGEIEREFAQLKSPARWIRTSAATRICTTLLDRATGGTTELVENAAPLTSAELADFHAQYRSAAEHAQIVVLTGSLPAGTPATYYRELLQCTPCRAVIDARGPELLAALELRPFLVKPNREELARTLDTAIDCDTDLLAAMHELNARGAEWVVVSQGRHAIWATSGDATYRAVPPAVSQPVNPIGCGDCLAAGIAWGLGQGIDVPGALRLGLAAAAQNLRDLLPARLDPAMLVAESLAVVVERA